MFWFLMFPYYSRRIYYPKLRNPDAQNIVASENHGKQCKSSDHWKTIKNVVFEKKWQGMMQRQNDWLKYKF